MTNVIFRKETEGVIAFFPDTLYNNMLECYSHNGQHSTASYSYYKNTKSVTLEECEELITEMKNVGYDDLCIRYRINKDTKK